MTGLRIDTVSAGYGCKRILDGFTLPRLAPGSVTALLGANGAGKSTLLKSLAGVLRTEGRVGLDDTALMEMPQRARAAVVGYLPQTLPSGSSLVAYEVVAAALRAAVPDLTGSARAARIEETFARLGIGGLALRRLDSLSGGQRQLVALAQVFARTPRLMLLDEPTSALDLRWQIFVLEAVREAARRDGSIALVAIHDINLALRFADSVAVLKDGRPLTFGAARTALTPEILGAAYGVSARVESCSRGYAVVIADRALAVS
ncbi:MAG: ABC transporter ATP-binding protein [Rhodospirillaceae bacterium]